MMVVAAGCLGLAGSSEVAVGADGVVESDAPVEMTSTTFSNQLERSVDLYWDDGPGNEAKVATIQAGKSVKINTWEGHAFFFSELYKGRVGLLEAVEMDPKRTSYFLTEGSIRLYKDGGASRMEDGMPADCQDRKNSCPQMARQKQCQLNPGWMIVNCPRSCRACELTDPKLRCDRERLNISTEPAFKQGQLHEMFSGILTNPDYAAFEPSALSTDPWIIQFDNFLNDTEADALWNSVGTFVRSTDTGAYNKYGEAERVVSQSRTSQNAWCRAGCEDHPMVKPIIKRIEDVTGAPYDNSENFQVLQYEPGQYYRVHHDFGASQINLACGPRVLTFFLYLSDVEEGGETAFPRINLKVKPKKGRAILWPSVTNDDVLKQDSKTFHEALPVVKGLKLAANSWIHLYNFKVPNLWGCTGAFD